MTCGEIRHLLAGLARAPAETDFVPLTGVDHVLKQDPTGAAVNYAKSLPYSRQLQQALRGFVERNLCGRTRGGSARRPSDAAADVDLVVDPPGDRAQGADVPGWPGGIVPIEL